MTTSGKILILSIGFLTTFLIFVEAGHHGSSNELATLLAAGLITLMLKEGSSSRSLSLARHAHGLMLPTVHGLSLDDFSHPRPIGGFGFQAFNFAPMFGGLRYHLAGLDPSPLPRLDFGKGMNFNKAMDFNKGMNFNKGMDFNMPFGRNYGLYPPLPDMVGYNRQNRANNHFDLVHNILQREREHNPPHNVENQNEPPFNPEDREFFNNEQGHKTAADRRKQNMK